MSAACDSVDDLTRQHPEWTAWLALVRFAIGEMESDAWDTMRLLPSPARDRAAPLMAHAVLHVDSREVERLLDALTSHASGQGSAGVAIERDFASRCEPMPSLEAALNRDRERLAQCIGPAPDADACAAVLSLSAKPLLHACRRLCAQAVAQSWQQGYCPICAGWPAFAEVRGVERTRYLRCGDCGHGWPALALKCAYCGTTDHDALESLVPEQRTATASVEVCNRCRGYLKVFTTLRGASPAQVLVRALASAEFDLAALELGYRGASGVGHALTLKVVPDGVRSAH